MVDIGSAAWLLLAAAALLIGISKTALPGMATITVGVFAAVLPPKPSTAAVLVLLILGDLFAIWTFRRDVDWGVLRRLVPSVLFGLLLGTAFLYFVNDTWMRRSIGIILLLLIALTLFMMRRGKLSADSVLTSPKVRGAYGVTGGFTTMAANAGGPVMTLYFIAARFDVMKFMGTQAWYFFTINMTKVPLQIGLGQLTWSMAPLLLSLAPAVVVGALIGRKIVKRLNKELFDRLVIILTVTSAVYLLF